ncbi:DeoR faimly transcriptional regulator [Actinotalea fermentans ATCC 43279 = JCM 9966 = DSM 3133]|uniref:bifunctional diaminohydroxyphosphoribosylaminopyrimidine deaminase/5-amino-6-(5-phosphoribosylamino)uracil reductase RibD n=1 Tax=Actinotalea fermentans TaxID=43671 RepID=UPI00051F22B8|nr:DeoR faimly transcriptional regulator [Actinotalea fermentans ATCC 43279 = JCM 9966 = DSM 3133]
MGASSQAVHGFAVPAELAAMDRALELARLGPAHGPNPRVGCVLLDADGRTVAEGWHEGAGTLHAEAAAVAAARASGTPTHGTTAVVTLEPCNHTGRTPPCADLLLDAGVDRVVYGLADPNPRAAGGASRLREAGVDVVGGVRQEAAAELLRVWAGAVRAGRPWVTLKLATSLDGRVAAADGSSRWITSEQARAHAHRLRAEVGAIAIGTGTALTDDPALTARTPDGRPAAHQPVRVVVGLRDLPATGRLQGPGGELVHVRSHDPAEVVAVLAEREVRHLLVEGGPTLAAAFLRAGLVDEVVAYLAPVLLGAGPSAVADLGITVVDQALRLRPRSVEQVGPDVVVVAELAAGGEPPLPAPGSPTTVEGPGSGPAREEH